MGIRFLAATYVLMFHSKLPQYLDSRNHALLANFVANGNVGVQLFFVLSGFVLAYNYCGRLDAPGSLVTFWEARWARIWPLYGLSLVLSTLANHARPAFLPALSTLLMVQSWDPFDVTKGGLWNSVCWTLSCEAFFYLIFPFWQRSIKRMDTRTIAIILACNLIMAVAWTTCEISYASTYIPKGIPLAVARLPDFLIGVCLGNIFIREKTRASQRFAWFTWVGVLSSAFVLAHTSRPVVGWSILGFCSLLYGLSREASVIRQVLSSRLLQMGGAASYSIYLMQWPMKTLVFRVCDKLDLRSMNVRFMVFTGVLIAFSWVMYEFIEEPAREAIRNGLSTGRSYLMTREQAGLPAGFVLREKSEGRRSGRGRKRAA